MRVRSPNTASTVWVSTSNDQRVVATPSTSSTVIGTIVTERCRVANWVGGIRSMTAAGGGIAAMLLPPLGYDSHSLSVLDLTYMVPSIIRSSTDSLKAVSSNWNREARVLGPPTKAPLPGTNGARFSVSSRYSMLNFAEVKPASSGPRVCATAGGAAVIELKSITTAMTSD